MSYRPQTPPEFVSHLAAVTHAVAGRRLDAGLQTFLREQFPAGGAWFDRAVTLRKQGVAEGWLTCSIELAHGPQQEIAQLMGGAARDLAQPI